MPKTDIYNGLMNLPELAFPQINYPKMPLVELRPLGEAEAELYMNGLRSQVKQIEASLRADQELVMICWQGQERMQVLAVSMPSNNVVALRCKDAEGSTVQVTGHMNSVIFSFRVVTTTAPAKRNRIGFEMPGSEETK